MPDPIQIFISSLLDRVFSPYLVTFGVEFLYIAGFPLAAHFV